MRLIDADICIAKIKNLSIEYDAETVQRCIEVLSNEPTIDAMPKIGQWVKADRQQYFRKHYPASQCSICGWRKNYSGKYNYCPNCGAKMC